MYNDNPFTYESFGEGPLPANWEEICDYLNNKAAKANEETTPNDIWEEYWQGKYPDAPEAHEEKQDPAEAFNHLYRDYEVWSMARDFYDGGYRPGDEEDLILLFRDHRDENNREREEQGDPWRHTEETDKMLVERLVEEFRQLEADEKAAAEEE